MSPTRHIAAGKRVAGAIGLIAASTLVIAGCSAGEKPNGSTGDSTGVSVPYGATKEQYREALADMEPVVITMQSTAAQGADTGRRFEEYAAAVDDWSDGKVTFEIAFSNSIAPPIEVDDAIGDGRIGMGATQPALEPAQYPATNLLITAGALGRQTPIDGMLQWTGALLDIANGTEEIYEEYGARGLIPLVPIFGSGAYLLQCPESETTLAEMKGKVTASTSTVQNEQLEALGMSPVTLPYSELFEGLQRGAINCALSSLTVSTLMGLTPVAPHFAYDENTGFGSGGGTFAVNKALWEGLPLAAQQLLYDRLDVFIKANIEATWDNIAAGMTEIDAAGGSVAQFDAAARDALGSVNSGIIDGFEETTAVADPVAFAERVRTAEADWQDLINGLGIADVDVDYNEFLSVYSPGEIDLSDYLEELWANSMMDRRPE